MGSRIDFHHDLVNLIASGNVYFQPPPSIEMEYPCIVYKLDRITTKHANNNKYNENRAYQVTVIDRDPDSYIPGDVGSLPKSKFNRFFVSENLNHFVYTVFF
jgi:hypothetical protein